MECQRWEPRLQWWLGLIFGQMVASPTGSPLSTPARGPPPMLPDPPPHRSDIPTPLVILYCWDHIFFLGTPCAQGLLIQLLDPEHHSICSAHAHLMNEWINELLRQYNVKLVVLTSRHSPVVLHLRKLFFIYLNSWFCCVPISITGPSYKSTESIFMGQSLCEVTLYMFLSSMT